MSLRFGPVRQLGLVVAAVDEAVASWTATLGVGPFFVLRDVAFTDFHYRGQPAPSPLCDFAVAQWGALQVEIIAQTDDAPSAYREFRSAGRSGVQHVSSWFDDRTAYEAARAAGIAQGLALVQESRAERGRFCYFETGTPDAPMIELAEALLPGSARRFTDVVAAAAADWDGSDPVRDKDALRAALRTGAGTGGER